MKKKKKGVCIAYTDDLGRRICLEGTVIRKNRKGFLLKVFKKMITFKDRVVSVSFCPEIENISMDFKNLYCRDQAPFNLAIEAWDDGC